MRVIRLLVALGAFAAPMAALAQDASQDPSSPAYQQPSVPVPASPIAPQGICSYGC